MVLDMNFMTLIALNLFFFHISLIDYTLEGITKYFCKKIINSM